jgi:hypothetical protein
MQAGLNVKKVKELMQELLGGKAKITDEILHLFTVSSKMYCGQLTEEARLI